MLTYPNRICTTSPIGSTSPISLEKPGKRKRFETRVVSDTELFASRFNLGQSAGMRFRWD